MNYAAFAKTVSIGCGLILWLAATVPASAQTADSFNPGANSEVYSLVVQADGKILVAGDFNMLGGQPRKYIGRLQADGSIDSSFNPGVNDRVYSLALQPDGKILVGGNFTMLGGQPRNRTGRLNADGSIDSSFNPRINDQVCSLVLQPDGKVIAGGFFTMLDEQPRNRIGRFHADGSIDSSFNPGVNDWVYSLALQPDGKILVGGNFTMLGGQPRNRIGRLNADGSIDSSFIPEANGNPYSLVVLADGKILVGGNFTTLGGQLRSRIGRLHADGSLDTSFNPGADGQIASLAVQVDGKILVGGAFTTLGGQPRSRIGRLHADGSLDSNFNPGAGGVSSFNSKISKVLLQADGKILVGGAFQTLAGQPCKNIGRLNNTEPATQSLGYDGSTITWLRGGTSPEVWRTVFDFSTNGVDWLCLGAGTRVPGPGWQLGDHTLPQGGMIRARGYINSSGSSWFVEHYLGKPLVLRQPFHQTNNAGSTAAFSVEAFFGNEPLTCQWRKNGANLLDGENISGAQTPILILSNVLKEDEGDYSVQISSRYDSVTSIAAALTVIDPIFTGQPSSFNCQQGRSVSLTVAAVGTPPLTYQWWKDGLALAQGTASSLVLTNLQAVDSGKYWAVVSNQYGSSTSTVSSVIVNVIKLDNSFKPVANNSVYSLVLQPDGKVLIGGWFTTLGGLTRNKIGRLNADGSLDNNFNSGADNDVYSLAMLSDGKILAGGWFTTLGRQARHYIGRLQADGSLDTSFNPGAGGGNYPYVYSIALQADGKILLRGGFENLAGQPRSGLGRFNTDDSLESSFNPGVDISYPYSYPLAIQADGKILVGGRFKFLGGQKCNWLGRLHADGSLDTNFNPGVGGASSPYVDSLLVQADGKILVGGDFTVLGGQKCPYFGRLNADGSLDTSFKQGVTCGGNSLAVQADGKILMGSYNSIVRLNADGSLDTSFNPGVIGSVYSLAVQADGKILVGGNFTTLAMQTCYYIGRLHNTEPATQNLSYDGSTITWQRGGASPEVWRTVFEFSTNGLNWLSLGAGTRVPGLGWQLGGLALPQGGTIRARGFVTSGYRNGSSWFVETMLNTTPLVSPRILINDSIFGIHSNCFGFNFSGPHGQVAVIESSTNLLNWESLATNTLGAVPIFFSDPRSTNAPTRFYRVR